MYTSAPAGLLAAARRVKERSALRPMRTAVIVTALGLTASVFPLASTGMVIIGGSVPVAPAASQPVCASAVSARIPAPGATAFQLPLKPGTFKIGSPFGNRSDPINGGTEFHRGQDLRAADGTPIYAAAPGRVIRAGSASGFGLWIVVQHDIAGEHVDTVYGHMWPRGMGVKEGETVTAGQQIAAVGSNGGSTGPHLHFEIWKDGGRFDGGHPVDPMKEISKPPPARPAPPRPPVSLPVAALSAEELMPHGPIGYQHPDDEIVWTPKKRDYVRKIVGVGKGMSLPPQAWVTAVATTMVESRLLMYANADNPESLRHPDKDAVGSDHDSEGLFQQRAPWGPTSVRMDAAGSARLFYDAMLEVPDWRAMPMGDLAQEVQGSAFPLRYRKYELAAANAVRVAAGAPPLSGGSTAPEDPCSAL